MVPASAALALGGLTIAAASYLPHPGLHDWLVPGAIWRRPPFLNLTFDDGPDPVRTPRVLDILGQLDIRATFFLVGNRVERARQLTRRIGAEGHEIGNHGWDHRTLAFRSRTTIREQLVRCQDSLASVVGKAVRLVRPPFGRRDYRFYQEAERLELRPMFWSLDSGDWLGLASGRLARRVSRATSGDIVLFHDGNPRATGLLDALATVLRHHRHRLPRLSHSELAT